MNSSIATLNGEGWPEADVNVLRRITESYVAKAIDSFDSRIDQSNLFLVELNETENERLGKELWQPVCNELNMMKRKLPLYAHRITIVQTVVQNQFTLLTSKTGSGKSNQLPQYFYFHPVSRGKQIICTQPRKLTMKAMARRVNEENANIIAGAMVFMDLTRVENPDGPRILYSSETALMNYMLTQMKTKTPLRGVSILIIDEAHERTLECDIILGIVKKYILPKRKDFRLIITSASIQCSQFMKLFGELPVIECSGTVYPVVEHYLVDYSDYFSDTVNTTERVILGLVTQEKGNETILVFLVNSDELGKAEELLKKRLKRFTENTSIHLLHGKIESAKPIKILEK